MTLLSAVEDVCDQIAIKRPGTVYGSTDQTARRCLSLLTTECRSLVRKNTWSVLIREHAITTASGTASYNIPADFDRYISDTAWDATHYWQMRGSLSPQEWQWAKRSIVASATNRRRFRLKWSVAGGGRFVFIDPTPTSIDSLIIEYVSSAFAQTYLGADLSAFTDDGNLFRLDESLIKLGLRWRLLNAMGQPYAEEREEYEEALMEMIAQDAPQGTLYMGGERNMDIPNVGDGDFGA